MARRPNYIYANQTGPYAGLGQSISNLGTALFGDPAQAMQKKQAESALAMQQLQMDKMRTDMATAAADRASQKQLETDLLAAMADKTGSMQTAAAAPMPSVTPPAPQPTSLQTTMTEESLANPALDQDYFAPLKTREAGMGHEEDYTRRPAINPETGRRPSTALGPYQLTQGTGERMGLPADQAAWTPEAQDAAIQKLTMSNVGDLQANDTPTTRANVYAAHHFGSGVAANMAQADYDTPMASLVSADQLTANPYLKDMTVGQWYEQAMSGGQFGVGLFGDEPAPTGAAATAGESPELSKTLHTGDLASIFGPEEETPTETAAEGGQEEQPPATATQAATPTSQVVSQTFNPTFTDADRLRLRAAPPDKKAETYNAIVAEKRKEFDAAQKAPETQGGMQFLGYDANHQPVWGKIPGYKDPGVSTPYDEALKAYITKGMETRDASTQQAQKVVNILDATRPLIESYKKTGMGGETQLGWEQLKKRFGWASDAAAGEALASMNQQLSLLMKPAGAGSVSDYEQKLYKQSAPGLTNTPQGNMLMLEIMSRVAQRTIDDNNAWVDWVSDPANQGNPRGFKLAERPLFTQEEWDHIMQVANAPAGGGGAATGTPDGGAAAQSAPGSSMQNPMGRMSPEEASKLPLGTWFTGDDGVVRRKR